MPSATAPGPAADDPAPARRRLGPTGRRAVKVLVGVLVGAFALRVLVRLVGAVDWPAVGAAFRLLPWWAPVPLLAALLARQVLNAVPLAVSVPGLPLRRSMQNDLAANLVATMTPPPADVVLRVAMFRSWGIDAVRGMTGVTVNTLTFYSVRFLSPVLGALLLTGQGLERRQWVTTGLCGTIAAVVLGGTLLLLRSDALAATVGRSAGRLVRPVRRSTDPQAWAARVVAFRADSAGGLRRALPRSVLALVGMVLADALVLLAALRMVGVPSADLSTLDVVGGFLLAYPLTLLPLFGLGVLDAVLIGAWTVVAGHDLEPAMVAGTVVWRVVTIMGPWALGALVLAAWRRSSGSAAEVVAAEAAAGEAAADPAPTAPTTL
ncbi:MAG TPA: lysylphosphatidylglycerol synthase domain-containing protein [Cellulomonas sp.]